MYTFFGHLQIFIQEEEIMHALSTLRNPPTTFIDKSRILFIHYNKT